MSRTPPHQLAFGPPAVVLALWAAAVNGAEWSVTPVVRNTLLYDDNRRLTLRDHEAVWGNRFRTEAQLRHRTERSDLSLSPRLEVRRFSGEKDILDREDRYLDGDYSLAGERYRFELSASLGYRGSLTTDLEAAEATNINSDTRNRSISATWSYALAARNTVQLAGTYSDLDYDLDDTTALTDYRVGSLSVTGIHQLTQRDQLSLTAFRTRFDSPTATTTRNGVSTTAQSLTTTTGFQLGWSRTFSETLQGSISAGVRRSDTTSRTTQTTRNGLSFSPASGTVDVVSNAQGADLTGAVARVPAASTLTVPPFTLPPNFFAPGTRVSAVAVAIPAGTEVLLIDQDLDQDSRGLSLDASLEQTLESWSWSLGYSRSLTPLSNGALRERDDLNGSLRRRFSERLTGLLDGRYYEEGGLDDDDGADDRTFLRLSGGLRWRLSPYWTLSGRYQYRRNENRNAETAESNALLFTLAYSGEKTAWSR